MRFRTFIGILVALTVVVSASYLSNLNVDLLVGRFALTPTRSVPVYIALLAVFLVGFLPAVGALLTFTLRRDLAQRRERRLGRQAKSRRNSYRRAVDLHVDGQWNKAAAELEGVLADRPEDFSTLLLYGEVLRSSGRGDEALEVHRRASVLYPQSVAVLYQLAEDYEATGEAEVGGQIRDRILRDFPTQGLRVLRRRRNDALSVSDWREARRLQEKIEPLLAEGTDEPADEHERAVRLGLEYQEAVSLLEAERPAEAESILGRILEAEPRFIPAVILAGESRLLQDDESEAVATWGRGFEATGSPIFLQRFEDHFIEREQPAEAIETLHSVIAGAETDLLPRFFLGRLYHRLEMHEEALRVLEGLEDRVESSPTFRYMLARIHERRGEMRKAYDSLQTCVQEAGIPSTEFVCHVCSRKSPDWVDRCDACGSWNSVEMDFEEEKLSDEQLGVRRAPVQAIYDRYRTFHNGD